MLGFPSLRIKRYYRYVSANRASKEILAESRCGTVPRLHQDLITHRQLLGNCKEQHTIAQLLTAQAKRRTEDSKARAKQELLEAKAKSKAAMSQMNDQSKAALRAMMKPGRNRGVARNE
eukprot:SAG31_NODE_11_length_38734_cov_21.263854_11_plen_119_part_00